ncbi:MAG: hypothetical protein C5B47_03225 [Verrucomicrobia bacterium]|nr:MAG: hypothetical protein C5B47_03225 [Verrucomicrobiota bacterium]
MKLQKISLDHIAKLAGVHKATVSRALRNHPTIPRHTRERIHEIAKREGYRPNPLVSLYQSHTRANRPPSMQATLAWINDYPNQECWREFPWLKGYFSGAKKRCEHRGYHLEELMLPSSNTVNHAQEVNKLADSIRSRGVFGVILPLLLHQQYLIEQWEGCAVALIGSGHFPCADQPSHVPFYPQGFSSADRDLFYNLRLCFSKMRQLGYQRIGLVYSKYLDTEAQGRVYAGYLFEQNQVAEEMRIPAIFLDRFKEGRPAKFDHWIQTYRPEAIICVNPVVKSWVESMGLRVPEDIGLANLNLVEDVIGWDGVVEQHEQIGAASVDLLIGQLSRSELQIPREPRKIFIPGAWADGTTLRPLT